MNPMTPEKPQKTPNILVVDDTPANLKLLTEMLKKRGYRVRPVASGKLAIQAVQKEKPDLILLDIVMPEMNGYEVCQHLKADEALKAIPILFISALDEPMDKVKAFAVGGVDYVTKPFQFNEVEARVQTHLQLHQFQLELEWQNRQLQVNNEQLQKLEELQNNLTHMVVHDMRSPLLGITGFLDILEKAAGTKLNQEELEYLSHAQNCSVVLIGMVNTLLDVCRLEQGEMPLKVTEADLEILTQKAFASLGSLTRKVTLVFPKQARPVKVNCDANLVTRIIANLVGNAIKFTPEGRTITVSIAGNEEGTQFRVTDTGRGIPREYHEKIFEKFGQVEAREQGKVYSTGLGLTFCKLAVEAHGGKIGVDSEMDKGSTFWFTLPAPGVRRDP